MCVFSITILLVYRLWRRLCMDSSRFLCKYACSSMRQRTSLCFLLCRGMRFYNLPFRRLWNVVRNLSSCNSVVTTDSTYRYINNFYNILWFYLKYIYICFRTIRSRTRGHTNNCANKIHFIWFCCFSVFSKHFRPFLKFDYLEPNPILSLHTLCVPKSEGITQPNLRSNRLENWHFLTPQSV